MRTIAVRFDDAADGVSAAFSVIAQGGEDSETSDDGQGDDDGQRDDDEQSDDSHTQNPNAAADKMLTKDKSKWKKNIPYVSSLLSHDSVKTRAKALWLLGEMGLAHPESVHDAIPAIAAFISSPEPLLRERAANSLGRIGRADFSTVEPYRENPFRLATDENAKVRPAFIWASENIATNTPDVYEGHMQVFGKLLHNEGESERGCTF